MILYFAIVIQETKKKMKCVVIITLSNNIKKSFTEASPLSIVRLSNCVIATRIYSYMTCVHIENANNSIRIFAM